MNPRLNFFLLIIFALGFSFKGFSSHDLKTLLAQGDSSFSKRNDKVQLEKAVSLYQEAYLQFPKEVEPAWKYSMALHSFATRFEEQEENKRRLFEQGIEIAKQASQKDPLCGPCQFWAAIHMAQHGELVGVFKMITSLSEIKERLEQAAQLDPAHAMGGPYRVLGTIYQVLPGILGGDSEKAAQYFKQALLVSPNEPINYLAFAKLQSEEGNSASAQEIAREGLRFKTAAEHSISLESRESLNELSRLSNLETR